MAKKRKTGRRPRRSQAAEARTPAAEARTPASEARTPPPESRTTPGQPVFWFGFEVSWPKLLVGRIALFGLLAIDALLQIKHAPRYGAGGFNVAQIAGLDAIAPTRAAYEIGELVNAYLFALAALGVATRVVVPIATMCYAWLYFASQLDSYQHHYLVSLVLLLACFVPWQRPEGATPQTRVRTWAIRLLLVQLAIMYAWAAISKMNGAWVSGATLTGQIGGGLRHLIDATIGIRAASCAVLATEVVLAATIWWPRLWWLTAPLGLGLHVAILFSHLEIGLFAWLMLGFYTWVVPDRLWVALAGSAVGGGLGRVAIAGERMFSGRRAFAALALGAVPIWLTGLDHARATGIVLTIACGAALVLAPAHRRRLVALGAAHVLALALWLFVDRTAGVAADYYRFWGGNARRLGDRDAEEHAYRELLELAPDDANAHYHLGALLVSQGPAHEDEGLGELHEAERLEPNRARGFVAEARWLVAHARRDDAIAKARDAARAEPGDRDARELLDTLVGSGAPAGPPR